ncbi:MAG: hypothetical protein K6E32_02745 [Lachnospiraceae bacterium]|nr:hypothetical protein [Lachnospiraceae bacterium]
MTPEVQRNVERILVGNVKFVSTNLGFNMLISKLQRRVAEDPSNLEGSVRDLDTYVTKYKSMLADEVHKIAAL